MNTITKDTLRKLCVSFKSRKSPEYRAFREKILIECGIAYPTFFNYQNNNRKSCIPKLVQEKIVEIVHRDYPDKVSILTETQES